MSKVTLVKNAMLSVQRYPWEQGVCMQALYELGDINTAIAMAHDAVLRQKEDGRLAVINDNIAVTDPAANGEVVLRAYEITGDSMYKEAADKMLSFLLNKAPRTENGTLCHNEVSFHEGYSPNQIWVDSIYMAPPFLAAMGEIKEAYVQIKGMYNYLYDSESGLMYHIYDAGTKRFVRKKHWTSGNGWALLGMARVIEAADMANEKQIADELKAMFLGILNHLIPFQLEDGRFHDIIDEESSFIEGAGAMMMAAAVFRGIKNGWLSDEYMHYAKKVQDTMDEYVDEYGIIHEVCGCPHFLSVGTSAESMAAYIMMHAYAGE